MTLGRRELSSAKGCPSLLGQSLKSKRKAKKPDQKSPVPLRRTKAAYKLEGSPVRICPIGTADPTSYRYIYILYRILATALEASQSPRDPRKPPLILGGTHYVEDIPVQCKTQLAHTRTRRPRELHEDITAGPFKGS